VLSAPGVSVRRIGTTGGAAVMGVAVADLIARNDAFFQEWMEG